MNTHISLTQFLIEQQRQLPEPYEDFSLLLKAIASACQSIAETINCGAITGVLGSANTENIQGETQKQLDIISHDIMVDTLAGTGLLSGMVSEEVEQPIAIPEQYRKGKYLALFDPLDGSSNIDVNLTVGTIFSILEGRAGTAAGLQDFLQKGTRQVCAGFVLYGPATMMILTTGQGVNGFTLDQNIGEFVLTHRHMRIPEETSEFSINISNQRHWEAPVQRYIAECLQGEEGPRARNFNMRWVASMVADVYRILTRGGIFMYPFDNRDISRPGKLRLLYEVNPMAYIVEQAGGACSTGRKRILDIVPDAIHQRVPVILGSKSEVARVLAYHQI